MNVPGAIVGIEGVARTGGTLLLTGGTLLVGLILGRGSSVFTAILGRSCGERPKF